MDQQDRARVTIMCCAYQEIDRIDGRMTSVAKRGRPAPSKWGTSRRSCKDAWTRCDVEAEWVSSKARPGSALEEQGHGGSRQKTTRR